MEPRLWDTLTDEVEVLKEGDQVAGFVRVSDVHPPGVPGTVKVWIEVTACVS